MAIVVYFSVTQVMIHDTDAIKYSVSNAIEAKATYLDRKKPHVFRQNGQ